MTAKGTSDSRPKFQVTVSIILVSIAVLVSILALRQYSVEKKFHNPIAYTVMGDTLYVVEKKNNTVLKFDDFSEEGPLLLNDRFSIEGDDDKYYYMLRRLYPGPNGVVVRSFVYEKKGGNFVGYRFREYPTFKGPPKEIFTIYLKDPKRYPDINYAFDKEGCHYFLNNCKGQHNIWKLPKTGNIKMAKGVVPAGIKELGDRNEAYSYWGAISVGADGGIFASPSVTGRVAVYSRDGRRVHEIGSVGFQKGELLAPIDLSYIRMGTQEPTSPLPAPATAHGFNSTPKGIPSEPFLLLKMATNSRISWWEKFTNQKAKAMYGHLICPTSVWWLWIGTLWR